MRTRCHGMRTRCHGMRTRCHGMRSFAHELTHARHVMRSACHDMTSPCHDMTSPCHDMTSPCHDMTSPCHDMTSPAHAMPSMRQMMTVGAHAMLAGLQKVTAPRHARLLAGRARSLDWQPPKENTRDAEDASRLDEADQVRASFASSHVHLWPCTDWSVHATVNLRTSSAGISQPAPLRKLCSRRRTFHDYVSADHHPDQDDSGV